MNNLMPHPVERQRCQADLLSEKCRSKRAENLNERSAPVRLPTLSAATPPISAKQSGAARGKIGFDRLPSSESNGTFLRAGSSFGSPLRIFRKQVQKLSHLRPQNIDANNTRGEMIMNKPLTYWPLMVYFGAVLLVVSAMIGGSWLLGEHHRERATGEPYESGIPATGSARLRFPASFYLIAMFFVVFDVESVFLFAWAVAAREIGWAGYAEMVIFVGILLSALVYLWRTGALDRGARQIHNPSRKA